MSGLKMFISLIMFLVGFLLTGVIPHIGMSIFGMNVAWPQVALFIGISASIIVWILVGLCIFSAIQFNRCWFIVVLTLSFISCIIWENLFIYKADWFVLIIGFAIPMIIGLIIIAMIVGTGNEGESDSDFSSWDYDDEPVSEPIKLDDSKKSVPSVFKKSLINDTYDGDDGTVLEPGFWDKEFRGSNGVTYTMDTWGDLKGSDGTHYQKDYFSTDFERKYY